MKKKYLLNTFMRMTAVIVFITITNYTFAANVPAISWHLAHGTTKPTRPR
jgi:hypothetical protein